MALAVLFDVSLIDRFGADFEDFLPGMFFPRGIQTQV